MGETKIYQMPESNSMLSALAPLLQQRGIDPSVFAMMRNNGCDGNWFIWLIFLLFLFGYGGNGFGRNNDLANAVNNDAGRDLLMQAINGNGNALNQLASTLNCSTNQIQQAINNVLNGVTQVGNQVGQSGMQIINAIQSGNCSLANQMAQCCCDIKQSINTVNTGLERGFSNLAYETQKQTCDLSNTIRESTAEVLAGQRAAEMREMQRELAERDRKIAEQAVIINNGQQTAIFQQMLSPITASINALQADINGIKCKMPETATVPNPPGVLIPNCVAAQYGYGLPYPNGFWG